MSRILVKFKDGNHAIFPLNPNCLDADGNPFDRLFNVVKYHTIDDAGMAQVCNVRKTKFSKHCKKAYVYKEE